MDNLYENLENYNDENNFEELKKENNDLRMQLVEYTVAMEKLQKEFNHLNSEFKKLERNYSSLLKTAKEEIKRKTAMITKLNIEKDAIVLNAIQNKCSNKVIRSISNPQFIGHEINKASYNKGCKQNEQIGYQNERKEENRLPRAETVTGSDSIGTALKQTNKNVEKYCDKGTDFKENICKLDKSKKNTDISNSKPLTIRNRRKSMPAIRCEAKFSSDEEYHDKFDSNQRHATANNNRDQDSIKSHNDLLQKRFHDNRLLTSETSSMDDRYSNYYDNNEFRNRSNRYNESERNRYKEQNAPSRFTRHYSPDWHRYSRNNNYNYRQENYRSKVLESPPPDKLRPYPRTHDPRTHEPRRYNREENRNRSKEIYQDKYTVKHKLPHDSEEPSSKRRRNDSSHYSNEEKCKESYTASAQTAVPTVIEFPSTSCQSPDYVDTSTPQPVKEIMNTAVTQLEDPRLNSKCYILDKSNDVLSTAVGRNFDLKVLTAKDWNIESVEIPKALRRRPSQCSEDINTLDVEYAACNLSVESDEILNFDTDEGSVKNFLDAKNSDHKLASRGKPTSPKRSDIVRDNKNISESNIKYNNMNIEQSSKMPKKQSSNVEKYSSNKRQKQHNLLIDSTKIENVQEKPHTDVNLRKMVEGDLELSDDTCDVTVVSKKDDKESSKKRGELNRFSLEIIPKTNIVENISLVSEKNIIADVFSDKQSTCSDKKSIDDDPQKQRKRSLKLVKKVQSDSTTEKKNKSENESKEIKTKFCELFGDSSSLITPEDLGLGITSTNNQPASKSIPLCEDAQDAVDLNVTNLEIAENCLKPVKLIVNDDRVSTDNPVKDVTINNSSIQNKDSAIKNNDCLQNVVKKSETTDNIFNDGKIDLKNAIRNQPEILTVQSMPIKHEGLLKALATSTPHKEFSPNEDVIYIPEKNLQNDKDDVTNNNDETVEQSSINNTLDSHADADAPDVRIFVKRRRKMVKKPKP